MSQSNFDQSQFQHKDCIAKFCFQVSVKMNYESIYDEKGRKFETIPVNRSDIDQNFEKLVSQHTKVIQKIPFFHP